MRDDLPRDLRDLVAPRPSGADYVFVSLTDDALAALLRHPRRGVVVDSLAASGRISPRLAEELRERIR